MSGRFSTNSDETAFENSDGNLEKYFLNVFKKYNIFYTFLAKAHSTCVESGICERKYFGTKKKKQFNGFFRKKISRNFQKEPPILLSFCLKQHFAEENYHNTSNSKVFSDFEQQMLDCCCQTYTPCVRGNNREKVVFKVEVDLQTLSDIELGYHLIWSKLQNMFTEEFFGEI